MVITKQKPTVDKCTHKIMRNEPRHTTRKPSNQKGREQKKTKETGTPKQPENNKTARNM